MILKEEEGEIENGRAEVHITGGMSGYQSDKPHYIQQFAKRNMSYIELNMFCLDPAEFVLTVWAV